MKGIKNIDGHVQDGKCIDSVGNEKWYKDGFLHRDDGPAVILSNGNQYWYNHGFFQKKTTERTF